MSQDRPDTSDQGTQSPPGASPSGSGAPEAGAQRVDKWLWYARFFKTRSLAGKFVGDGRVRLERGGQRTRVEKPSHALRPGDILTFPLRGGVFVVQVRAPGTRRGPAAEAQTLYDIIAEPAPKTRDTQSVDASPQPVKGTGRPTKKQRRTYDRLSGL
ncbi:MAG: RNA-binding S4 domain-containing protein [Pseudomonadota bacterium]